MEIIVAPNYKRPIDDIGICLSPYLLKALTDFKTPWPNLK